MRAVWDAQLPQKTTEVQQKLVGVANDCGFDTLITSGPALDSEKAATLQKKAAVHDMDVLEIVLPYVTDAIRESLPESARQRVHPVEQAFLDTIENDLGVYGNRRLAHYWVPPVLGREFLCFIHPQSHAILEDRVTEALKRADGIALDGFGYRNQYACFCDRCRHRRETRHEQNAESKAKTLRETSEETLVTTSERLNDHAQDINPDAVVTNHLWPPFRPNPTYGHRLKLDYCSQTISWYYRPTWSIERVEFEAAEHRRLETPSRNRFVPFVAMYDNPGSLRSAERLR